MTPAATPRITARRNAASPRHLLKCLYPLTACKENKQILEESKILLLFHPHLESIHVQVHRKEIPVTDYLQQSKKQLIESFFKKTTLYT